MSEVYSKPIAIADMKQQIHELEDEIADMQLEIGRLHQLIAWLGEPAP